MGGRVRARVRFPKAGVRRGFTLIEVLIVVVILGILAAMVVPAFSSAAEEAQISATQTELARLERALEVFRTRNENRVPVLTDGSLPELVSTGEYLAKVPRNSWVGGENATLVVAGSGPDSAWHAEYGWIYDQESGSVWAAAFDAEGRPHPKP